MCLIMLNDKHLCCGSDSNINIYEIDSGKIIKQLVAHTGLVRYLLLLNNTDNLLSSSDDRDIRMWSCQNY